jgi:hypothetical protein
MITLSPKKYLTKTMGCVKKAKTHAQKHEKKNKET